MEDDTFCYPCFLLLFPPVQVGAQEGGDIQAAGIDVDRFKGDAGFSAGSDHDRLLEGRLLGSGCRFHFGSGGANHFWGAGPIEAGGDDRDAYLFFHVLVDDGTEDHVHIGVRGFFDDGGSLVDLVEGQAGTAGDVEEDTAGAIDGDVEELVGDRLFSGFLGAVFAAGATDCHQRSAAFGHDGFDVSEIEVDKTGDGDDLGDALHTLAQHIICGAEGILQRGFLIRDLQQAVIGDDDEGIGMFLEAGNTLFGCLEAFLTFKGEGAGDHANGQCADFAGDLSNDGGCAGAGAAAHAGGDEYHVTALKGFVQFLRGFLGGFAADLRIAAGAETLGGLVANAHFELGVGVDERLGVGVDGDELDALHAFVDHAVDGITAAAADADDLDAGKRFGDLLVFGFRMMIPKWRSGCFCWSPL